MNLAERGHELRILKDLADRPKRGFGGLALIGGGVGQGKTTLLNALSTMAAEAGAVVLRATAAETERGLPLGLVGQLLSGAQGLAEGVKVGQRLLEARLLPPFTTEAEHGGLHPAVLGGLAEELLVVAKERPLVIAVDDVDHADAESLVCLLYLARRAQAARFLLVMTERGEESERYSRFRAEVLGQAYCRNIRLKPVSRAGVAEMLTDFVDSRHLPALSHAFHRLSGGNPLLLSGLLEDYRDMRQGPVPEVVPGDGYGQAVVWCLYRSAPSLLRVAQGMAVLGTATTPVLLSAVLDRELERVCLDLQLLTEAGVLEAGRFRHETAIQVVLQRLPPEDRSVLHKRAATALHDQGASAIEVARHVLAVGDMAGDWVVPTLLEAAEWATADADTTLAVEVLRLAHALSTDDRLRAKIRLDQVRAEWRISPSAAARHLPELVPAAEAGLLEPGEITEIIAWLLWLGQIAAATGLFELVGADDASPEGVELGVRMWMGLAFPQLFDRLCSDLLPVKDHRAQPLRSNTLMASRILASALEQRDGDETKTGGERILESTRLSDTTIPAITAALNTLVYLGDLDTAALWCDSLVQEAAERRAPMWQALFLGMRGLIGVHRGELVLAENAAVDALDLLSARSWGVAIALPISVLVLARIRLGKVEGASAYLNLPVPDMMYRSVCAPLYLHARGSYHLATGRSLAALDDFEMCGELMEKWGLDVPTFVAWRTDAARALLALGRADEARDLLLEQLAAVKTSSFTGVKGVAMMLLAAAGEPGRRIGRLREAIELLEIAGDRWELYRAVTHLAEALRAQGQEDSAAHAEARARRLAEECGVIRAPAPAGAGEARLDGGKNLPRPIAELSYAELRVAQMAAHGHSNRQIASALSITVSTVEQHLTRVYRKLRVKRRADLPRDLLDATAAEDSPRLAISIAAPGRALTEGRIR